MTRMRKRSVPAPRQARKSFEKATQSARRALVARKSAEAVRLAIARVVEMEEFWQFMTTSRGTLRPGSIETP